MAALKCSRFSLNAFVKRQPPYAHPHREILSLHMRRADGFLIWAPEHAEALRALLRGAVALHVDLARTLPRLRDIVGCLHAEECIHVGSEGLLDPQRHVAG